MYEIPAVALGDAAIAAVALLIAAYEIWLFLRDPSTKLHAWIAAASVLSGVYACSMIAHYSTGDAATAIALSKLEAACIAGLGLTCPMIVSALLERPIPRMVRGAFVVSAIAFLALLPTDLLISNEVELRQFGLMDRPFLRLRETPLLYALMAYGAAAYAFSVYWLRRHRKSRPRDAAHFLVGFLCWILVIPLEAVFPLFGATVPMNLFEYGFIGFGLALVTNDLRRYMSLLDATRRSLSNLVAEAPDPVARLDKAGAIIEVNASFEALLGRGLIGRSFVGVVGDEHRQELRDLLTRRNAQSDAPPLQVDVAGVDGSRVPVELVVMRAQVNGEESRLVLARDLSQRQKVMAQLLEADRTATMGTLGAAVGHEISNPLSFVLLNTKEALEILDGVKPDVEGARARLATSIKGIARISDVVRALAFFSRRRSEPAAVSVDEVVRAAVSLARNEVEHRARLDLDIEPSLHVHGIETRLAQVLLDLILNAAHAIPEGSASMNRVSLQVRASEHSVLFRVSDSGEGISPAVRDRVFEPFFSMKPSGRATGLGLSISRETVQEMGGALTFDNEQGGGTSFQFELPRVFAFEGVDADEEARSIGRRPLVLLVDDEAQLLTAMSRALRPHADILTARSAREAVERLEAVDGDVDLVLSDLMMPDGSGRELHQAVRARWPELESRLLFMTGGVFTEEAREFERSVDRPVLQKPVDLQQIRRLLLGEVSGMTRRHNGEDP